MIILLRIGLENVTLSQIIDRLLICCLLVEFLLGASAFRSMLFWFLRGLFRLYVVDVSKELSKVEVLLLDITAL